MHRFRVAMAAGKRQGSSSLTHATTKVGRPCTTCGLNASPALPLQAFAAIGGTTANHRRLARRLAIG